MSLPNFIANPDPLIYLSDNWIALDLETTNINKGDAVDERNSIVYGYWVDSSGNQGDIDSTHSLNSIRDRLYKADFVIAHGAKFELKWSLREGIDISRILIYDTLLGEYVIAGNRKFALDLDSTSVRYGGEGKASLVTHLIHSGVCPSTIPSSILQFYCKQDVREAIRVFQKQRTVLHESGLLPVFFLRCITTPVLADIESNGLFLDKEVVREIYRTSLEEYSKIIMELNKITGGINMASPQQVARFLYTDLGFKELTDKKGSPIRGKPNKSFPEGQPLTDEDTVAALHATTAEQRRFREFKTKESKLRKKITAYMERYMYACGLDFNPLSEKEKEFSSIRGSCMIHGTLNQSISQTHRLTSSNPNLQNIDRKLKRAITARRKGWKIRSADYKTLEFTVGGILSQDPQIKKDIETSYDIHSYTASIVFKDEWIEAGATKKTTDGDRIRTNSKPHTFKPMYGGQSGSDAERAYYKAFREKYRVLNKTQKDWVYEVLKNKKLRTVTGLIFYWPDTKMTSSGYITNSNNIFDYPVQMFATADIAPTGVCLLWHCMKAEGMKSFLINEVHDSMVAEECPEESEKLGNLIEFCLSKYVVEFLKTVIGFEINYPINIEQKSCSHWDYDGEKS